MYQATQSNKFWSVGDVVGTFKYFKCGRTVYTRRALLVTKLTDLFPPGEQSVLQEKLQVAVMNCLDINGNFPVSKFLDIVKKVELVTETPLEHSSPSNSGDEVQPIGLQHWCGPMTATNLSSSPSTSSFIFSPCWSWGYLGGRAWKCCTQLQTVNTKSCTSVGDCSQDDNNAYCERDQQLLDTID